MKSDPIHAHAKAGRSLARARKVLRARRLALRVLEAKEWLKLKAQQGWSETHIRQLVTAAKGDKTTEIGKGTVKLQRAQVIVEKWKVVVSELKDRAWEHYKTH